jgi:hypothetical protein
MSNVVIKANLYFLLSLQRLLWTPEQARRNHLKIEIKYQIFNRASPQVPITILWHLLYRKRIAEILKYTHGLIHTEHVLEVLLSTRITPEFLHYFGMLHMSLNRGSLHEKQDTDDLMHILTSTLMQENGSKKDGLITSHHNCTGKLIHQSRVTLHY